MRISPLVLSALTLAALGVVATSVQSADLVRKSAPPVAPAIAKSCTETTALPADAFGFGGGSDVASPGDRGLSLDTTTSLGVRDGRRTAFAPTVQFSYGLAPCFEVGPFINGLASRTSFYDSIHQTETDTAFGGGVEFKYKLLHRSQQGIGLTLSFTPGAIGQTTKPGNARSIYTHTFKLLADTALGSSGLYGALNLELTQGWSRSAGDIASASGINARLALTKAITEQVYLGAEASVQSTYNGAAFNTHQGHAVFVGPTFLWQASEKITLNGAYAYQIAGNSVGVAGRALAIDLFPRHQARLKLAYAF